jgi:hypothetical protein
MRTDPISTRLQSDLQSQKLQGGPSVAALTPMQVWALFLSPLPSQESGPGCEMLSQPFLSAPQKCRCRLLHFCQVLVTLIYRS